MSNEEERKSDHLKLTDSALMEHILNDKRFNYEPLQAIHPSPHEDISFSFLDKKMAAPLWISSMTGGTKEALIINENLAKACAEFKLGMGLGSCRQLLHNKKYLEQFNWRFLLKDRPFYANLGIAQVEQLLEAGEEERLLRLVDMLEADGLIIHVNPLQEWLQMEGDRFRVTPLKTLESLLKKVSLKIIVKEVGQGMGPKSLNALLDLPLAAIDFAAFGGTNFSKIEILRSNKKNLLPLASIGHTAEEMVSMTQLLLKERKQKGCTQFIVSGGIKSFLDGFYLCQKLEQRGEAKAVYGQAHALLQRACRNYNDLQSYIASQIEALKLAKNYLHLKE